MPQLNPLDWAPQIIWLVITFGILYVLMKRVALPRIGSVIEARHARIAGDIEAADKLRRETQEAIAAYEQALAEAKAKAHAIAQEASNKLKDEVAAERAALEKDLAARSAEAEKRISEAKMSALKDVNAVLHCAAWATSARNFTFQPKDGDEVIATGHLSFYAPQGRTQLYVSALAPVGDGALAIRFRALCEDEGFLTGEIDTQYLDRWLAGRAGPAQGAGDPLADDLALAAAALEFHARAPKPSASAVATSAWKRAGRASAMR